MLEPDQAHGRKEGEEGATTTALKDRPSVRLNTKRVYPYP